MIISTKRTILRTLELDDAEKLQDYFLRNQTFLKPWEPERDPAYYQIKSLRKMIRAELIEYRQNKALRLYIQLKGEDQIIGFAGLTNILYGYFRSCFLGYKLDKYYVGQGIMTETLEKVISHAFTTYDLHRIESAVMPENKASRKVLNKLGFREEGFSKDYLKINGKWEDHIIYALLNPASE